MANIPLQSISFPGLSDKYTTPTVDSTLTQTGAAADAKKTGDEIAELKNDLSEFPNGNYPQMGAGYANQLVSGLKKEDSTPYNFRRIPYDATLEEVKKIVGGTVAWNQFATTKSGSVTPNGTNTYSYSSFTSQNTIIAQHKYFICADVTYNGAKLPMRVYAQIGTSNYGSPTQDITVAGTKKCAWIAQFTSSSTNATLGISNVATSEKLTSEDAWSYDNAMITDLTQMFGTTIADYVYSLEQATAGAGVAWLNTHFPAQFGTAYQAYDTGTLKSIEGLTAHQTVADGVTHTYPLDSDLVLRGIPKVDASGNLYYDGDEYLPDGTVNRRYDIIDLGSINWTYREDRGQFVSPNIIAIKAPATNYAIANIICPKYLATTASNTESSDYDKIIGISRYGVICIRDSAYNDATAFKTAMSGVYLVCEKATPTTETADPYTTPQIIAPDGTEEYIYEDSAFELPVGHSSDYPIDVSGQLDDILDTPSANGTYVLKATVTDGAVTYSWVADA